MRSFGVDVIGGHIHRSWGRPTDLPDSKILAIALNEFGSVVAIKIGLGPLREEVIQRSSALSKVKFYVSFTGHEPTVLWQTDAVSPDVEELVSRLDQLNEDLADLAMRRLRDSIDAGGDQLPVDEKLITRARRAVEKASTLLRSTGADGSGDFG